MNTQQQCLICLIAVRKNCNKLVCPVALPSGGMHNGSINVSSILPLVVANFTWESCKRRIDCSHESSTDTWDLNTQNCVSHVWSLLGQGLYGEDAAFSCAQGAVQLQLVQRDTGHGAVSEMHAQTQQQCRVRTRLDEIHPRAFHWCHVMPGHEGQSLFPALHPRWRRLHPCAAYP